MNKRDFLKTLGVGGAAMALAPSLFTGCDTAGKKRIKNWRWIHNIGNTPLDEVKARLEKDLEHGIEAVLMENNISDINIFDRQLPIPQPALERLVEAGKATGMEIHCWMWQMPNNAQDFAENKPDWYAVNGNGDPANTHPAYVNYYRFMCPNHPEVQEYLRLRFKSVGMMEDLAGLHLDYIRLPDVIIAEALQPVYNIVQDREYPEYDYCYCTRCRSMFKEQTGIDPLLDFEDPSTSEEWRQFRYDSVTNLVNNVMAPEARKAGKMVTAAVFPNWEAVRQEWRNWDLDAFLPMLYHSFYNADIQWIGDQVRDRKADLRYDSKLYSGLYLPALNPEELRQAYEVSIENGADGISLFGGLSDAHYDVLKDIASQQV